MIRSLFFVLLLSQCAFGQKAGSVEAYRFQYENEMRRINNESDWNSAKKLCKFFDPIEHYKDAKQDFSAIEVPNAGAVGFMQAWPFKVISIVDKKNAILSMSDLTFWLEDFDTSGLVDGESVRILDPIEFTATKQYNTALGSSKTVKAFKMIDKPSLAKHKEKLAEEAAKKAKDKRKAISQVFEFTDGENVEAVFIDIRKGKVILEDLDGKPIENTLNDFSAKSSAKIRELFKNKPKLDAKKK